MVNGAPFAPWSMHGEGVLALCRRRPQEPLAVGLTPSPGPTLVAGIHYTDSPVGPYLALVVAVPARLGARMGLSVVSMVVDHPGALSGACLNWGFPARLGRLRWMADGPLRRMAWEDHDIELSGRGRGFGLPVVLPHTELQVRSDGPVMVPDRLWGIARPGRFTLSVPDPLHALAPLAGRHLGMHLTGVNRVMREARTPIGLVAPLRAAGGVEPILSGPGTRLSGRLASEPVDARARVSGPQGV